MMSVDKDQEWAAYYYLSYYERGSLRHLFHKRRIDALAGLVPTPGRVLDAGCGSGVMCRILADKGCEVAGVDLLPERVAWSKRIAPEADIHCGDLRSIRLNGKYDAIVCSEVLEHFSSKGRQEVLRNLVGNLEPGGTLILTVPSRFYLRVIEPVWTILREWQYGKGSYDDDECHEAVSAAELRASLESEGCEVRSAGYMCWGMVRWCVARKR